MTVGGIIIGTLLFLGVNLLRAVVMPPSLRRPYKPENYK